MFLNDKHTRKKIFYRNLITILSILVIGIGVYLGFTPLFELVPEGVSKAVISSSFGAIFVIILTMYLLNKQTEIEQESKKSEKVFEEKIKIYYVVLNNLTNATKDKLISSEEFENLRFDFYKLRIIAGSRIWSIFKKILDEIETNIHPEIEYILDENEFDKLHKNIGEFVEACSNDLDLEDTFFTSKVINKNEHNLKVKEFKSIYRRTTRNYDKFNVIYDSVLVGANLNKGRTVLKVISEFVNKNKNITFEGLNEKFPIKIQYNNKKSGWGTFKALSEAKEIDINQKRFFFNDEEIIKLKDEIIVVTTQWGYEPGSDKGGSFGAFLDHCSKYHGKNIILEKV